MGLDYLHRECNIIHTDIKPENILFCVSEEAIKALATKEVTSRSAGKTSRSQHIILLSS